MALYTTEITSSDIASDNPIHQRLFFAYWTAKDTIKGDLLEIGCGGGRGLELLVKGSKSYTAVDKNEEMIELHGKNYPKAKFINANIPPLSSFSDNSFDTVITFQVIEHIQDDKAFIDEIYRVLRPGGKAYISTPNINWTLTRNPWHIREYTPNELTELCKRKFSKVEAKGISGDKKVLQYYEENKKSVEKIKKWDFLDLENKLPASILRIPYDFLNRRNRKKLMLQGDSLAAQINYTDFHITEDAADGIDLFYICEK